MNTSVLRFDRNIFLIAAVGLVGNGHAELPAFQQGLQIMRRKVLNVFEATELGNFCLTVRFHTVCDDFILRGDLWGSP